MADLWWLHLHTEIRALEEALNVEKQKCESVQHITKMDMVTFERNFTAAKAVSGGEYANISNQEREEVESLLHAKSFVFKHKLKKLRSELETVPLQVQGKILEDVVEIVDQYREGIVAGIKKHKVRYAFVHGHGEWRRLEALWLAVALRVEFAENSKWREV